MKKIYAPFEDYVRLITLMQLTPKYPNSIVSIISWDKVSNFVIPKNSLTLDLVNIDKDQFYLTFQGPGEVLRELINKKHILNYIPFFHPQNGARETLVKNPPLNMRDAFIINFNIVLAEGSGEDYPLKVIIS